MSGYRAFDPRQKTQNEGYPPAKAAKQAKAVGQTGTALATLAERPSRLAPEKPQQSATLAGLAALAGVDSKFAISGAGTASRFEEAAAIAEYDGGLTRHEAECVALAGDPRTAQWLAENPPAPLADHPFVCIHCGYGLPDDVLPLAVTGPAKGAWVHRTCYGPFRLARQAQALAALTVSP